MKKVSAGLLMYKFVEGKLKIFLVHPGGPFWKDKDAGAWGIPKGEPNEGEDLFEAARREFYEETGVECPIGKERYFEIGEVQQKSGKIVHAWAFESSETKVSDPTATKSHVGEWSGLLMCRSFAEIEWPYKSGKMIKIPEIDKAGFFDIEKCKEKMNSAQWEFVERLIERVNKNEKTEQKIL